MTAGDQIENKFLVSDIILCPKNGSMPVDMNCSLLIHFPGISR